MKPSRTVFLAVSVFISLVAPAAVQARQPSLLDELTQVIQSHIDTVPASAQIEAGFSPEGSAERLVLKTINAASRSVRLAAYSFTSPTIVRALISAKRRGVDVRVVADESSPTAKTGASALNLLVGAGIATRLNGNYAIHHDKYLIVDGRHLQTGSFNYSRAAASSNSENVLVIWHNPELAAAYLRHWDIRFAEGHDYQRRY